MKIFLSHKSDDKMTANELRKRLRDIGGVEVFLDIYRLDAGDVLDENIERELSDSDAVVVLYSSTTDVSEWVRKEVATGVQLKKTVIPCVLDRTLPTNNPALSGLLYLDFSERELGMGQLCLSQVIPRALAGAGYSTTTETVKDYEAAVSHCIRDLIVKRNGVEKAEYWRREAREEHRRFAAALDEILAKIDETSSVHGTLTGAVAAVDDMQARLDELLTELGGLEADPYEATDSAGRVRGVETYSEEEARAEIRDFLGAQFDIPADSLESRVTDIHYFIERSPFVLAELRQIAARTDEHTPIHRAVSALIEYLDDPHDLLPEAEWGYIGYLDDAWLINNLAFRVQEFAQFEPTPFPVDRDDLIESDEFARIVLPEHVVDQLEGYLVQLVGLLFGHAEDYEPTYYLDEHRVPRFFMSGVAAEGSAVRTIESYSDEDAQAEIREFLENEEFGFRRRGLEKRVIGLYHFIERSPLVLEELREIAAGTDDTAVHRAVAALCGYLDDPHDLLPDEEWGYVGYLDDAWLVNNFALRIQNAVEYDPDPFPVDWDDLIESDEWVRALLPEPVLEQLEEQLEQLVAVFMS